MKLLIILLEIGFVLFFVLLLFHLLTRKYLNPYKLYMVFGKKGSGKSTLMTRLAIQHLKKGWTVYCSEPINVDGVRHFDIKWVGRRSFESNSLVLIDEVGMIWDNRDFKTFAHEVRDWFKLQRHYKCKVYLFSQSFDIDKKLRDLTDGLFLCSTKLRVFSWAKRIHRSVVLTESEADRESRISEDLKFDSIIFWPFGSRILTYIPRYAKYFDSHSVPEKPSIPYSVRSDPVRSPAADRFLRCNKAAILLRSLFIPVKRFVRRLVARIPHRKDKW